ncbi:MAG: DUF4142 domain-containing protein [Acetobacteraceae bacterium]|nr:DUF4142 domain-containing protein [Acetobacteraceae bacterium]MBV8522882.1 DUF4142 domain-containing protein [Acetobacteraceae bacterium]
MRTRPCKITGKGQNELQQIARNQNIDLPSQPTAIERSEHEKLSKLSGTQFDRAYAQDQVSDHKKSVELFQREATSGQAQQLKAYAQKMLPILRQHLQMAQELTRKT